jgi:hypothetical protein
MMPLRFLLDENLRGQLWDAISRHNTLGGYLIDALRVGDPGAPSLGTSDPDLLVWAEHEQRVLVSIDRSTIPRHIREHLNSGHHTAGVILIRKSARSGSIVSYLETAAYASEPHEWRDQTEYVK